MKVIYIAGPFRAANAWEVEQNIRLAEGVAFEVASLGYMPLCPHPMTRFFDGTLTDEFWLHGTLELMKRCDGMVVCGRWQSSAGCVGEIEKAIDMDMPWFDRVMGHESLKYFLEELEKT